MNNSRVTVLFLLIAVMLLAGLMLVPHNVSASEPVPDLQCIMLFGCWYMPFSTVVSQENSYWVWCPWGTILRIGDWRMLWNRNEWREVL